MSASTPVVDRPEHHELETGIALHERIDASRWCVTKDDLVNLRKEVTRAIVEGSIKPTPEDNFDPADREYGPCIYTVNDQYIKRITATAGGMSWALMRNPSGLCCDLFITHAWREGIFEFLDKVLYSWPRSRNHCWCCMLAIPQNMDISHMIRDPISSPFAVALQSAKCMLVVPNRTESIYTRLWCAYEATLAHRWGKVIMTATSSPMKQIQHDWPYLGLCLVTGMVCSLLFKKSTVEYFAALFLVVSYPLILASTFTSHESFRRTLNYMGVIWSTNWCGLLLRYQKAPHSIFFHSQKNAQQWQMWHGHSIGTAFAAVLFFFISDIDRMRNVKTQEEAEHLRAGYTGSICHALCTDPGDAASIRADIGDRTHEVDTTIQMLIDAGMTSADLRAAAQLGVDVDDFTSVGYAFLFLTITMSIPAYHEVFSQKDFFDDSMYVVHYSLNVMNFLLSFTWLALFCRAHLDTRIWFQMTLQKVSLCIEWPVFVVTFLVCEANDVDVFTILVASELILTGSWVLIFVLSVARIHRVAAIPVIGPFLAQLFVARGRRGLRKSWCRLRWGMNDRMPGSWEERSRRCDSERDMLPDWTVDRISTTTNVVSNSHNS